MELTQKERYVYTVVDSETGEFCKTEHVVDYPDEQYELVDGAEWRKFKLVPVNENES